jgi:hypothetical protein
MARSSAPSASQGMRSNQDGQVAEVGAKAL